MNLLFKSEVSFSSPFLHLYRLKKNINELDKIIAKPQEMIMFQHVLCVYPYRLGLKKFKFCPPLGLEYIATVAEPHARSVEILDLRKEPSHTADYLRPETDMVCFSIGWQREIEFLQKEILSVPADIFTILGGQQVTDDPEGWLADCPNVNAVVRGDGEEIMEELCQGAPLEQIAGLSFRKGNEIIHNPARRLGPVADHLYPHRSLRRYTYELEIENFNTGIAFDLISASRGCPFNCTFCSINRNPWGEKRNWSGRSPESVVEELESIEAPFVAFTDELFTCDMDWVDRICDLIIKRGIRKKYIVNARLEIARCPDVIQKMEKAGFAILLLGIESAQDKTLLSMRKGFNTAKAREYFDILCDRSLFLHGYFILGNIGESVQEMEQIVPFARELGLDTLNLSVLHSNPYSGIEELVAQNPSFHIAASGKIYSDHCSIEELKRLRGRLSKEFYTRRHILNILFKALRNGFLRFFPQLFLRLPRFVFSFQKAFRH
jgi:anaerobic magnesium-protoporphyrin IX monomethyl ester cyclase